MDVALLKDIVIGTAAVLAAGVSWWNFFQSPSKDNAASIAAIVTKLTDHDRRIQTVEGELRHLPDQEAVHELKLAIVELKGTVKNVETQVTAVGRTVSVLDNYLRSEDRPK